MFLGYLNHDENINQWFDSGDLVDIDKDGFLQILGRSKELINVAGNKLLACEVETCIMELEQISDVIVYAKPSLITGEMVVCDVVSTLNKDETKALIKSHCKAKLERYKVPVKILIKVIPTIDNLVFGRVVIYFDNPATLLILDMIFCPTLFS